MIATLKFNLPEEREEFQSALNGQKVEIRIDDIWNEVWRPRYKHGYSNPRINELLEDPKCNELMDLLEDLYRETENN